MTNNETTLHKNVGSGFLWIFWLVAVGAWAIQLFVSYALVEWHCARPQAFSEATLQWTLGLLTLTCLAVTLINLYYVIQYYRQLTQQEGRTREVFLAAGGALLSGFLAVTIGVQGWPGLVLNVCTYAGGS